MQELVGVMELVLIWKAHLCVPATRTSLGGDVSMKTGVLLTRAQELVRE